METVGNSGVPNGPAPGPDEGQEYLSRRARVEEAGDGARGLLHGDPSAGAACRGPSSISPGLTRHEQELLRPGGASWRPASDPRQSGHRPVRGTRG